MFIIFKCLKYNIISTTTILSLSTLSLMTYDVCLADGVQVGGVLRVLQVGQGRAEVVVHALSAVVVPLHVQQMGDHVHSWRGTQTGDTLSLITSTQRCG